MYLVDTSAWVEYFRRTGSRADDEVTRMVERTEPTAGITEPVIMELLAGARDTANFRRIERITDAMPLLEVYPPCDFGEAGSLFLTLRRKGKTIRSMTDCIIASVAWRLEATLVHADRDFDVIAGHFPELRVMSLV
ncbi:MAG TPA: PIN domain nuclease [Trebonia sp.]|nr:PIN domain nuclease [Trebonia sp.]